MAEVQAEVRANNAFRCRHCNRYIHLLSVPLSPSLKAMMLNHHAPSSQPEGLVPRRATRPGPQKEDHCRLG